MVMHDMKRGVVDGSSGLPDLGPQREVLASPNGRNFRRGQKPSRYLQPAPHDDSRVWQPYCLHPIHGAAFLRRLPLEI